MKNEGKIKNVINHLLQDIKDYITATEYATERLKNICNDIENEVLVLEDSEFKDALKIPIPLLNQEADIYGMLGADSLKDTRKITIDYLMKVLTLSDGYSNE